VPKLVQKKEIVHRQKTALDLFCIPGTSAEILIVHTGEINLTERLVKHFHIYPTWCR